jgi:hypothetical protein
MGIGHEPQHTGQVEGKQREVMWARKDEVAQCTEQESHHQDHTQALCDKARAGQCVKHRMGTLSSLPASEVATVRAESCAL